MAGGSTLGTQTSLLRYWYPGDHTKKNLTYMVVSISYQISCEMFEEKLRKKHPFDLL